MEYITVREKLKIKRLSCQPLSVEEIDNNIAETKSNLIELRQKSQMYSTEQLVHNFRILRRGNGNE